MLTTATASIHPTPVGTQVYDGNGNVTSSQSGSENCTYDDENRLVSAYVNASWKTDFVYDGLSRLRSRSEYTWLGSGWYPGPVTTYVYDGMRVIQERGGSSASYTRGMDLSGSLEGAGGIGGLLARSSGSTHSYYHADCNGNITYLVNTNQTLAASYRYDPYGNTISSSGTLVSANVYRFSSKEIHVSSGLYYYGYRWYDPNLQRWLTRDPVGESGGVNLYCLVLNDPAGYADDFGLGPFPTDRKDPKGNPWPQETPTPFPPGGPVAPQPNLPTEKINPKSTPTEKNLGDALRRCQCTALGAFALAMNKMWTDISEKAMRDKALSQCEKTPHSKSGNDSCCVISKTGNEGCITGEVVWNTMTGYVVKKPCNQVQAENHGSIHPSYGKKTVHRNDHIPW
jgi:RHS repeat-associated protein